MNQDNLDWVSNKGYAVGEDGSVTPCPPAKGDHYSLGQLQEAVGGHVEIIYIPPAEGRPALNVVLHEEGKSLYKVNRTATEWCRHALFQGDYIAGPALFCVEGSIL